MARLEPGIEERRRIQRLRNARVPVVKFAARRGSIAIARRSTGSCRATGSLTRRARISAAIAAWWREAWRRRGATALARALADLAAAVRSLCRARRAYSSRRPIRSLGTTLGGSRAERAQ